MNVVCLVFDQITILDAVGPLEVLARLPGTKVHLVAPSAGTVRSYKSEIGIQADHAIGNAPEADLIVIPGGPGVRALLTDSDVVDWLRRAHERSSWTTSVCTGSLLLGAAGLLEGKRATTHWNAMEDLRTYGATPVTERVVVEGKIVMGAGVSAGIDMALTLARLIAGEAVAQAIQLQIEYDPEPPFDCGSPAKADASVLELARGGLDRL